MKENEKIFGNFAIHATITMTKSLNGNGKKNG